MEGIKDGRGLEHLLLEEKLGPGSVQSGKDRENLVDADKFLKDEC